jgi:hypothetical protein
LQDGTDPVPCRASMLDQDADCNGKIDARSLDEAAIPVELKVRR